ncbi:MAG: hypothetical protein RIK85_05890 [Marinobacter sp.]
MFSGCGKVGLVCVLAVSALMMSACVSVTSPEQVASNMRDLLDNHTDVNEVRAVRTVKSILVRDSSPLNATPILAAIVLEPERIPKLIEEGANVNWVSGTPFSPLGCATYLNVCKGIFRVTKNSFEYRLDNTLAVMNVILANGADPNASIGGVPNHLMEPILCDRVLYYAPPYLELDDSSVKKLRVLSEYGAEFDSEKIAKCRKWVSRRVEDLSRSGNYLILKEWQKRLMFVNDAEEMGINKALSLWENPDQYFSVAMERKEREAAERQRLAEINERKYREKISVIQAYINQDAALRSALSDIVQIGSEKKTVEWIVLQNRFGAEECETRVGGAYFKSNACESNWKVLMKRVKNHYSSLKTSYRKQRNWFAGLFGKNTSLVERFVDGRVANAPSVDAIKQHYTPAFQQLRRITDAEASAERSARKRQEQQMMADFMSNIQGTLERTNRMLDRSMARTQQTINQAYASQGTRNANTGSGYHTRSAPAMRDLDKKLEKIDRSFESSIPERQPSTSTAKTLGAAAVDENKVCAGPFHRPEFVTITRGPKVPEGPKLKCPAGTTPIAVGTANLDLPSKYLQGAMTSEPLGDGSRRYTLKAWDYECLCNKGSRQGSSAYQQ